MENESKRQNAGVLLSFLELLEKREQKKTKLTKNESLFTNGMKNSLGQNIT